MGPPSRRIGGWRISWEGFPPARERYFEKISFSVLKPIFGRFQDLFEDPFGTLLEALGDAFGSLGDPLGTPWGAFGTPLAPLGVPFDTL